MIITSLQNRHICILGFGREGQAVLRAIQTYAPDARVTIADGNESLKDAIAVPGTVSWKLGPNHLEDLDHFDVLIKSPGIPPQAALNNVRDRITNSTQIFMDTVKERGSIVIGITGSKGKSTVSSLIYAILKEAGKDVHLVGNIGIPTLDFLDQAKEETIFVQEMSSYQLLDCTSSPSVAVVTSFFPDHLDYHLKEIDPNLKDLADPDLWNQALQKYMKAKMHLTKFQNTSDYTFYDDYTNGAKEIAQASSGTLVASNIRDCPVTTNETNLIGEHNLRNIALASIVGQHLKVEPKIIKQAIQQFTGLPHRLQSLGTHHNLEWIDDAISTTPESTIAAIDALDSRLETIILGGQDRGNDFSELAQRIAKSSIKHIILFPESGARIEEELQNTGATLTYHHANTMEEAVEHCKKVAPESLLDTSPIVLLSTASPSYNMFKNFEEKGEIFKEYIELNAK